MAIKLGIKTKLYQRSHVTCYIFMQVRGSHCSEFGCLPRERSGGLPYSHRRLCCCFFSGQSLFHQTRLHHRWQPGEWHKQTWQVTNAKRDIWVQTSLNMTNSLDKLLLLYWMLNIKYHEIKILKFSSYNRPKGLQTMVTNTIYVIKWMFNDHVENASSQCL